MKVSYGEPSQAATTTLCSREVGRGRSVRPYPWVHAPPLWLRLDPVGLLRIPPACAPSPSRNPCASSQPTTLTWDRGRCPPPRSPLHRRWPAQRTPERPSVCRSLGPHLCP